MIRTRTWWYQGVRNVGFSGNLAYILNQGSRILTRLMTMLGKNKFKRRICGVLRDLVPFVQFWKCEKHPWRSVTSVNLLAEACNFTKISTHPWVFFTFLKLYKWYQITQRTTYYKKTWINFNTMVVFVAVFAFVLIAMSRLKLNIKNKFFTVFWFIKLAKC